MKKVVINIFIITILTILLTGCSTEKHNTGKLSVSTKEKEDIQEYIEKLYKCCNYVEEDFPNFSNINKANEQWIWLSVYANIWEDIESPTVYEYTYSDIEEETKKLFGEELDKKFPKEGIDLLGPIEGKNNMYWATAMGFDTERYRYGIIKNITKKENTYTIDLLEYIEQYDRENDKITLKTKNDEEVKTYKASVDGDNGEEYFEAKRKEVEKYVLDNNEEFTKKKIIIKLEGDYYHIKSCEEK